MTATPPDEHQPAPDNGLDHGWNVPAPCTQAELVSVLEDALEHVRAGDSREGTITWIMPTDEACLQDSEFGLIARYRIGNGLGQGGLGAFTKSRSGQPDRGGPNEPPAASGQLALQDLDSELAATLHVLDAPSLYQRTACHVDTAARAIDFEAKLAEPWSAGERILIEAACSLWGRPDIADGRLSDLMHRLDRDGYQRVLQAIQIRRGDD